MILDGLKLNLAAIGAAAAAAAIAGVSTWALIERAGRLECKVERTRALDQVEVLAAAVRDQGASIERLGAQTGQAQLELRRRLEAIAKQGAAAQALVDRLEQSIEAPTPAAADCRSAIEAWREELRR
jgi:hypothetical protein